MYCPISFALPGPKRQFNYKFPNGARSLAVRECKPLGSFIEEKSCCCHGADLEKFSPVCHTPPPGRCVALLCRWTIRLNHLRIVRAAEIAAIMWYEPLRLGKAHAFSMALT